MRDDLSGEVIRDRKMSGGLRFPMNGHMIAGVRSGGGMYRIDQAVRAAALAVQGAGPITMGKARRVMAGMVGLVPAAMVDDVGRARLLGPSPAVVRTLPPK